MQVNDQVKTTFLNKNLSKSSAQIINCYWSEIIDYSNRLLLKHNFLLSLHYTNNIYLHLSQLPKKSCQSNFHLILF